MNFYKNSKSSPEGKDFYPNEQNRQIATMLIENFKKGLIWKKPWDDNSIKPYSLVRNKTYKGSNAFYLLLKSVSRGYKTNAWLTYNDAKKLGGTVKSGEKCSYISHPVFTKKEVYVKDEFGRFIVDENGEKVKREKTYITGVKWFKVFNYDQCSDLPPLDTFDSYNLRKAKKESIEAKKDSIESCPYVLMAKDISDNAFVPVIYGGYKASYSPSLDKVFMPKMEYFNDTNEILGVLFHELSHASGASDRLNREIKNSHGSSKYAFEELVAELSSVFLCIEAGISLDKKVADNHTAYLESWTEALSENPEKILEEVLPLAQKACDFVSKECSVKEIGEIYLGSEDFDITKLDETVAEFDDIRAI